MQSLNMILLIYTICNVHVTVWAESIVMWADRRDMLTKGYAEKECDGRSDWRIGVIKRSMYMIMYTK